LNLPNCKPRFAVLKSTNKRKRPCSTSGQYVNGKLTDCVKRKTWSRAVLRVGKLTGQEESEEMRGRRRCMSNSMASVVGESQCSMDAGQRNEIPLIVANRRPSVFGTVITSSFFSCPRNWSCRHRHPSPGQSISKPPSSKACLTVLKTTYPRNFCCGTPSNCVNENWFQRATPST
jgi:hypothetical protein